MHLITIYVHFEFWLSFVFNIYLRFFSVFLFSCTNMINVIHILS